MGVRITEGWGGNRVYNGGAWMELYWGLDAELTGDPAWSLTGNGKIPNSYSAMIARLKISVVFDANTLDNSNSFDLSGSWPAFSGSVNIPTVKEQTIYNNTVLVYPLFGNTYNLRAIASLSGIDRVPGTTSFDRWISMPARAWATPNAPVVSDYSVDSSSTSLTAFITGNQNDPAQDKHWQTTDWSIYKPGTGWVDSNGYAGDKTQHTFTGLVPNQQYRLTARAWNEDGGLSPWSSTVNAYTKPSAPTITLVNRSTTTPTTINIAWTTSAAYPGSFQIFRRMTPTGSWALLTTLPSNARAYVDNVVTGRTPEYRILMKSSDGKVNSDYSNIMMADAGTIKQYIPGVNSIYVGGSKVTKVMLNDQQIWLDY